MVGSIIRSILFDGVHCNQVIFLQGVGTIIETAKDANDWTASMIVTVIAVASTFGLYRLAIHHHKEKIKENEALKEQVKNLRAATTQETKNLKAALFKCRQENKELKDEIVAYLIKSVKR